MDWHDTKKVGSKSIDGIGYDLSHLRDSKYAFTIAATTGYPKVSGELLIQYSSHCITTGPGHGDEFDFAELGHDRLILDDRGNKRCFCLDRYTWSKNLPDIIRSLPGDRMCYFTGHENWLSIEILGPQGTSLVYEVFFNLTRQSSKLLRVYVESAYVRTAGNEIRRPIDFKKKSKIRGKVLLAKNFAINPSQGQDGASRIAKSKRPHQGGPFLSSTLGYSSTAGTGYPAADGHRLRGLVHIHL